MMVSWVSYGMTYNSNLGYCKLIILHPFKMEIEAVGSPGEGLNTQEVGELLWADGVLGL
jgi:hypothetical protein